MTKRVLLASQYALYPLHWEPFALLCEAHDVVASVITTSAPDLPSVHRQLGWVRLEEAGKTPHVEEIRVRPQLTKRQSYRWLKKQLDEINPDGIWIQEEPTSPLASDILRYYRHDSRTRIAVAVCENKFRRPSAWRRWERGRLWKRIDCLLATAAASVDSVRRVGMPTSVPAQTLVAGAHSPPGDIAPLPLPFGRTDGDWVVGVAGRICFEKGWHLLLDALDTLPENFKVALAGDGPQAHELQSRLEVNGLADRAAYLGLLSKQDLWRFYESVDCLAVPSLTTPNWAEQFGGVLADAMAMGLPIIGSDSGAIPEVVGPAGLIVPENDVTALAEALASLQSCPELAASYARCGRERFAAEFSSSAYARKIANALQLQPRNQKHVSAA